MNGYEKNQSRLSDLQSLGKDLARRAKSKCELCETSGVPLEAYEVPPVPEDPELERILLLCGRCKSACAGGKLGDDSEWRFLETVVWSDFTALQVCAIRLLRRLATEDKVGWANSTLESVYPSEETEAWLTQ